MTGWVLATRDAEQLGELRTALAPYSLEVVAFPTLREADYDDPAAWAAFGERLADVAVLALTSPRAATALAPAANRHGVWDVLAAIPAATVGEATAAAAADIGLKVALVGTGGGTELAARILDRWGSACLVVHVCGREHRPELADRLRTGGASLIELPVYAVDLVPAMQIPPLPSSPPVAVVLSSPRATEGYAAAVGRRFAAVPHIAFGPATAAAASRLGFGVVSVAGPAVESIVEEICQTC